MSDNDLANVDDVLGFNLGPEESTFSEPLKPARVSRPRNLKDHHLTSVRGLPYVRSSAQKRARHHMNHRNEYKNLTNFLTFYQIWGHNLFPKSKFSDFLEMCATAGAESSVRRLRTQYMDEETGKQRDMEMAQSFVPLVNGEFRPSITPLDSGDVAAQARTMSREEEERLDEQDFEHQMFEQANEARYLSGMDGGPTSATTQPTTTTTQSQAPASSQSQPNPISSKIFVDDFDDGWSDDDADLLDDIYTTKKAPTPAPTSAPTTKPITQTTTEPDPSMEEFDEQNFEDEYEAEMELMREQGL